jgi:hypothetical protein
VESPNREEKIRKRKSCLVIADRLLVLWHDRHLRIVVLLLCQDKNMLQTELYDTYLDAQLVHITT